MKPTLHLSTLLLLLTLCSLAALPASADSGGTVKNKSRVTLSVTLQATADAPVGAAGTAEIRVRSKNGTQSARIELTVSGLAAGGYSVDATLADASSVNLGAFDVAAVAASGKDDGGIQIAIPAAVDALHIASVEIKDASAVVLLQGSTTASTAMLRYFANVPVTAPAPIVPGGPKIHGHALSHSLIINDVEQERHFLWVGFGAPANTVLTINVDGVAVGTVTSTDKGKVKFQGLPDGTDLASIKLITLTDPLNAVVMQAQF